MRRFLFLFAIMCLVALFMLPTSASARVDGMGISDCNQIQSINNGPANADYHLVRNIDCHGANLDPIDWTTDPQAPIPYTGTFDGNNFTISNFEINATGTDFAALFAYIDGANIKDLKINDAEINANVGAATLVVTANSSSITNVHVVSQVTSVTSGAGGLVYSAFDSTIDASSSDGSVEGFQVVGGLIASQTTIGGNTSMTKNSWSSAAVAATGTTNQPSVGGLIGDLASLGFTANASATVADSYASGPVNAPGNYEVGGLVGTMRAVYDTYPATVSILRTYSSGAVVGEEKVGGLIGNVRDINDPNVHFVIRDSFTVSPITGSGKGAIIGESTGSDHDVEMSNVYWGSDSTGINSFDICIGNTDYHEGCFIFDDSGANANHWKSDNEVAPLNEWDFEHSDWWLFEDQLPVLNHDLDEDGVSNDIEGAGLNDGDANGDNVGDAYQSNVASMNGFGSAQTIFTDNGYIHGASIQPTEINPNWNLQYGALDFMIFLDTGVTANIELFFYTDLAASRFTPVKISNVDGSVTALSGTLTDGTLDGQHYMKLSYSATDGGLNDQDNEENGIIVDPVTISLNAAVPPTTQVIVPVASGNLPATGNSSSTQLPWAITLITVGAFTAFVTKNLNKKRASSSTN